MKKQNLSRTIALLLALVLIMSTFAACDAQQIGDVIAGLVQSIIPAEPTEPTEPTEAPTNPSHTHTPNDDDGDCTTDITCSECGEVVTSGAESHTPGADDGDCTTAITCSVCGKEITAGAENHTPGADDGDCTTAITCSVCGKEITAGAENHTPNADDGDCTTAITCSVCGKETTSAKTHDFGDNNPTCANCSVENPNYIPPVTIKDVSVKGEWVDSVVTNAAIAPNKSFDGDINTKWNPQAKTAYAGNPGVVYILNRPADIQKITVTVAGSTHYFDVYTSTDGEAFTLLAKVCATNEDKAYSGFVCTLDGLNLQDVTHIKLMFTGRSNNSTYLNIFEVEVSEDGSDNLDNSWFIPEEKKEEVKATVSASEYISNGVEGTGGYAAVGDVTKAYDGNTGTKWNPSVKNYTSDTGVIFHLDNNYDLTKMVFTFSNPHYFKIYVSEDHKTYTELTVVSEAGQYNEAGTVCTLDNLTAENIKYVKIILTGREGGSAWVNFFEIEIYGTV